MRSRYVGRVPSATRYRCTSCGNLTRFDVTTSTRTRAFHHFTVGGELSVEDAEVLSERVDEVLCRWCGPSGVVEELTDGADLTVTPPA
jgi:hypothetical protein